MKACNPPLPKPYTHCFDDDTNNDVWSFSEAQLLAYRKEVIEMCAKVCIDLHANDQTNILYAAKIIKELK